MGSEQDPAWWDFPQALAETRGAGCYVTLFEAPFQASVLSDNENNALRASSLMAIPPLPPGSQPLAGYATADLMGNNLTQWASDVQEVASYMRWPPEAAVRCPIVDMIGVLNWLEGLAGVRYCRMCFGIGSACQCSAAPHQVSGPTATLWAPPSLRYAAMVSSTETRASTSTSGATSTSHSLPRDPLGEPMDMSSPLTTENLLATAGICRVRRPRVPLNRPTAPGIRQTRPQMLQQLASTTGEQGTRLATPYQQQVLPPKCPAPSSSTASSTSRDQEGPTGETESAWGRSSSRGPRGRRRSKSVA